MNRIGYSTGVYFDQETQRQRWAVLGPGDVWYFAKRYGADAARTLCRQLNRGEHGRQ